MSSNQSLEIGERQFAFYLQIVLKIERGKIWVSALTASHASRAFLMASSISRSVRL